VDKIRFSRHAEEKFTVLRMHGIRIARQKVIATVRAPDSTDYRRLPLLIAQSTFDARRVLRVVYRKEGDAILIITFYPGRKSEYEKE
jgi:hypothetical protein